MKIQTILSLILAVFICSTDALKLEAKSSSDLEDSTKSIETDDIALASTETPGVAKDVGYSSASRTHKGKTPALEAGTEVDESAKMTDAKINFTNFDGAELRRTNFNNADLTGASLQNITGPYLNFADTNLTGVVVVNSNLSGMDASGPDIT